MKSQIASGEITMTILFTALLTIAGLSIAGQRRPAHRPPPVVSLLIIQNPGKEGVIWAVGFDLKSKSDIHRRVRVRDQAEAEKMVALLQETAPRQYRFSGLVVI